MRYSIMLLTYNRFGVVSRSLASIYKGLMPYKDAEVIVIDNGSKDRTPDFLMDVQRNHDAWRVYLSTSNLGVAGGRNKLLSLARGELLVFLDTDVSIQDPHWLARLEELLQDKTVGVTGPSGAYVTPDWQWYAFESSKQPKDVDVVSGYCQAFMRDRLPEAPVLDEYYNPYWHEDSDFCLRQKVRGYRVLHSGEIGVLHMFAGSGDDGSSRIKQAYLKSKYAKYKGLIHAESEENNAPATGEHT